MRTLRSSSNPLLLLALITLAAAFASAPAAQQPAAGQAPQGRGGGPGRGGRGTPIKPGEECPPGTTEIRPDRCQAPEMPAPSILDYRPRSTLVSAEHPVPKAKFPAIDYHGHPMNLIGSAEGLDTLIAAMDSLNVRLMVSADNISGERLTRTLEVIRNSPHRDRVRVLAGMNFSGVGPGWAEKAIAQLEADVAAGAVGVGEIGKGFGLRTRKADGSRLAARRSRARSDLGGVRPAQDCRCSSTPPIPQEFFQPIDYHNERWLELALFPRPPLSARASIRTFEELMAERDNLFKQAIRRRRSSPRTWAGTPTISAGSARCSTRCRTCTPRSARCSTTSAASRARRTTSSSSTRTGILFGKDSFQPEEYPYYWRVFETRDDYFDYYRDYHAFWKLYGIDLPDAVLKKVYYQNALRLDAGAAADRLAEIARF